MSRLAELIRPDRHLVVYSVSSEGPVTWDLRSLRRILVEHGLFITGDSEIWTCGADKLGSLRDLEEELAVPLALGVRMARGDAG